MKKTYTGWVACSLFDSQKKVIEKVSITTTGRTKYYIEFEKEDDKAIYLLESYGMGAMQHVLFKRPEDAAELYVRRLKATALDMTKNLNTFLSA